MRGMCITSAPCIVLALCLPAHAEWVAGAYIGGAHTQNSDLLLRQPSLGTDLRFHNVRYSGNSFQGPLYYGAHGGYFFGRHWGIESEFTHLKIFAKVQKPAPVSGTLTGALVNTVQPADLLVQRFSISHGVNLLMANVVFRQPLWHSLSEPLGRLLIDTRLGGGATIPHPESTIQGRADEHYQIGRPVFAAAAGAELRLWRRLYWQGEYKYTRTRQRVDIFSGTAETLLQSHHLATGPVIHF